MNSVVDVVNWTSMLLESTKLVPWCKRNFISWRDEGIGLREAEQLDSLKVFRLTNPAVASTKVLGKRRATQSLPSTELLFKKKDMGDVLESAKTLELHVRVLSRVL